MTIHRSETFSTGAGAVAGLRENVPLAPLTTIGIGGPARYFLRAESDTAILAALAWATGEGLPLFVLGGGSNLLISDDGFPGLVLQIATRGIRHETETGEAVLVIAAAGEPWDPFVARCVADGLAGLECLSGIPGAVGATPIQNVGAYGQEVSETIVGVEAIDRATGHMRRFTREECRFAYRDSLFKSAEKNRYVILSVNFQLERRPTAAVRYPELEATLQEGGGSHELRAIRDAVINVRRRKGMVIDPDDPDTRSDGSFFTNPIIANELLDQFRERALKGNVSPEERIPVFPAGEGFSKLSAAWLIEKAGFEKGLRFENVGLSTKHTLAIVNRGGGTAAQILGLVSMIQQRVVERFGVELVPEPNFIGF